MNKYIGNFYHQMGVMLDAGMPLSRSLETAAEGQKGRVKKVVNFIRDTVGAGSTISSAMKKKRIFPVFDVTLVDAAEQSGNLDGTFKMLAGWYELRGSIIRKLKSSMMMPVLVLHLAFILGKVPHFIRSRMTGAEYLSNLYFKLILFWSISFGLYFLAKIIPRNGAIRKGFDFVILIIPLLGKALRNFAYGSYCKAFNMLYASGIPITMAAELAPDLAGNAYIGGLFLKASQSVQHGQPMFKGLSNAIPAEMRHMWMVGEESGQLDDVTEKLGKTYFDKAKFNFDLVTFWYPKIFYFGVMLYMIKLAADGFAVATSM